MSNDSPRVPTVVFMILCETEANWERVFLCLFCKLLCQPEYRRLHYVLYRQHGVPLFNALVRCEAINPGLQNLATRNYSIALYMIWCKAHFDILNRLSVTHGCDRQTDGQTNNSRSTRRAYVARSKPKYCRKSKIGKKVTHITCIYRNSVMAK